jgi:hypothetical protein
MTWDGVEATSREELEEADREKNDLHLPTKDLPFFGEPIPPGNL